MALPRPPGELTDAELSAAWAERFTAFVGRINAANGAVKDPITGRGNGPCHVYVAAIGAATASAVAEFLATEAALLAPIREQLNSGSLTAEEKEALSAPVRPQIQAARAALNAARAAAQASPEIAPVHAAAQSARLAARRDDATNESDAERTALRQELKRRGRWSPTAHAPIGLEHITRRGGR